MPSYKGNNDNHTNGKLDEEDYLPITMNSFDFWYKYDIKRFLQSCEIVKRIVARSLSLSSLLIAWLFSHSFSTVSARKVVLQKSKQLEKAFLQGSRLVFIGWDFGSFGLVRFIVNIWLKFLNYWVNTRFRRSADLYNRTNFGFL